MTPRSAGILPLVLALLLPVSGPMAKAVEGQALDPAVATIGAAWGSEDSNSLQRLLAPTVRLHVEGQDHLGVPPRQVAATLDRLFRRYRPERPLVQRQRDPSESGDGGFVEFRWSPVTEDTGERIAYVVFVVFRRVDDDWRVAELRVLR